jgi:small multidrug resistance pump
MAGRPDSGNKHTPLQTMSGYAFHTCEVCVVMSWFMLALAIASEVIATTSLKYAEGFTRLWPSIITTVGYLAAFALLSQALKEVPVSTAYAIWSGVGTATVAVIGIVFLGEPGGVLKTVGIAVIILGVVLLNLGGGTH